MVVLQNASDRRQTKKQQKTNKTTATTNMNLQVSRSFFLAFLLSVPLFNFVRLVCSYVSPHPPPPPLSFSSLCLLFQVCPLLFVYNLRFVCVNVTEEWSLQTACECTSFSFYRASQLIVKLTHLQRLDGLVVKASASRAEDPVFESRLRRDFSRLSHTSDSKIGTPVATLQGAWRYRVKTGTGLCIL